MIKPKQPDYAEAMEQLDKFGKLLAELPKLSSHIDKKTLIQNIIEHAKELVNADHVHVRVIDWLNNKLVLEEYVGEEDIGLKHLKFTSINVGEAIGGRVFETKRSDIINDVQINPDFEKYRQNIKTDLENIKNINSEDKEDIEKLEKLKSVLERIGRAIVVPLLLERKPIGVLTAWRREDTEFPSPFTENDKIILEHFANQASVALRNAWLFEAATWQPSESESFTVEALCQEVVNEAIKRTGARDGRVRFVNWKKEYIVPGALVWPISSISEHDLRVGIRKIGICPAGVVAKKRKPTIVNDLQKNRDFQKFRDLTLARKKSYQEQLEVLNNLNEYVEKNESNPLDTKLGNFRKSLKNFELETKKELEERLNILQKLVDDPAKFAELVTKQIEAVKSLAKAWDEYVNKDLKAWNSEVAVPILIGDKLLGVLNVHSNEKNWFIESDQAILQALASRVATSIMVHQQKVLNKIHEIEQRMIADRSFVGVASMVAEGIREVAFLSGREKKSEIFPLLYICKDPMPPQRIVDDQQHFGEQFEPQRRGSALKDEQDLLDVPIRNNGLGFEAIKELAEEPLESVFIVRENVDDPISGGSESAQKHGVITTACLPLAFGGIVSGILYIHIKRRHFFTELEKETLTLFAAHAAIVLMNLKRRTEERTYDDLGGNKLIKDCINIKKEIKSTLTLESGE